MPDPSKFDSKEDFLKVCIPQVTGEGKDNDQAVAVCNSMWSDKNKSVNKELKQTQSWELLSIKEQTDQSQIYVFRAATTVPDRVADQEVSGEILTKTYLDKVKELLNDESKLGGRFGAYRTISLFHDRVLENDQTLEEAGYILPTARVVPMKEHPGHYALEVDVKVNEMYVPNTQYPDYTPDKIKYKIQEKAIGLSIEYYPSLKDHTTVQIDGDTYRVVDDFSEFAGFGFARANVIGNTTAIAIKESIKYIEENNMTEDQTIQLKEKIDQLTLEVKEMAEVKAKLKETEQKGVGYEDEVRKLQTQFKELESKSIPAAEVKELLAQSFDKISFANEPAKTKTTEVNPSLKEVQKAIAENDWSAHSIHAEAFLKENTDALYDSLKKGIDFEESQTLQVKCVGRGFKIVPTAKTKDIIDAGSMAEGTYNQTNAMFADRYVAQITETFLMDDNLLKAMPKEQHLGGNDYYQWRIWTEFITTPTDTAAVNPNTTSVTRDTKNFEKLQTPIKEYRWGVEVSDFAQYHSRQAIGDLLGVQIERASKIVTQSMAADIFQENADGDGNEFLGLEAVADPTGNTTLYGKTRSAANRLETGTLADTYNTTSEAITVKLVRAGYEEILGRGSNLNTIAVVTHPSQVRKLFDSQDDTAATYNSTIKHPVMFEAAPPEFGFSRGLVPHIDGIPIIRDYNCQTDAFYCVDLSQDRGFVLVVSKPLGVRGLAKIGTSESAYVNFYGAAVYKSPINIYLHDSLT